MKCMDFVVVAVLPVDERGIELLLEHHKGVFHPLYCVADAHYTCVRDRIGGKNRFFVEDTVA